ncbi:putative triple gene block 3 [Gentian ovary ringspot virus]|uniref:Putative triple gene block 3 n=1 Tax=Gentian ovary ringspot virus TaxID=1920772 RepID=A0A077JI59_9VIRU|nr:putative triple gene block 3 [Gentian ovary ringspot virus]BAP18647.1 putative triple gene block 3 [Gentian ovary ringspot virus]
MEAPAIEHPQDCSCSFCAPPVAYGYTSRRRNYPNAQTVALGDASLEGVVFKTCLLLAIFIFTFGFYSFFFAGDSTELNNKGVSIYYQDLNMVEIRQYPGNEISPELIRQIHHFQKRPFGLPSDSLFDAWCPDVMEFAIFILGLVLIFLIMRTC